MLDTDLDHLETPEAVKETLATYENVVISSGRMGGMCLPVYAALEKLKNVYTHVHFFDQHFDGPAAALIKDLPECAGLKGLPYTVYFRHGKAVAATASIQSEVQIVEILDREFGKPTKENSDEG